MTVSSTTSRKTYLGDAVTTSFDTNPVAFFLTSDLLVYVVVTATGVATLLTENTHYTVSGGSGTTGTVSLAGGISPYGALSALQTLVIVRSVPETQLVDFVNNEATDAEVAEDALDKLTMICQQLDAANGRSFALAATDVSGASTVIPTPSANKIIGWNSAGTALQNYAGSDISLTLVSTFISTLIDDVDAATARATLGLTIGTNVQAYDADLTAIAALSQTAGNVIRSNGSAWISDQGRVPANLLINPNWQIDQINEGALYTVNTTSVQGPDGWSGDAVGAGVFKLRTLADPDNAALKCLEISCTTADASIAATDRYEIWTAVEGYDAAALLLGTSAAIPFTYQFKLKSNAVTGVFGVYFTNSAGNRFYAGTITVADTSEHEYSVPITGDLAGTWLYTNGIGLRMGLVLSAGSNFQGTAGAWSASTIRTTSSQANFMSANTNIIYLKRGSLHLGSLVQAYSPADIQRELAKAQRYQAKTFAQGTAVAQSAGLVGALQGRNVGGVSAAPTAQWSFPVTMRAAPTVVTYNPSASNANWRNVTAGSDATVAVDPNSAISQSSVFIAQSTGGTQGDYLAIHATAIARLS